MTITKNLIVIICFFASCYIIIAQQSGPSSSGAPVRSTGAINESTCAQSGCHDDNAINTGTAKMAIEVPQDLKEHGYIPSKIYHLKVAIADASVNRFGFQILAIDIKTGENVGQFIVTDVVRTQIYEDYIENSSRKYLTYTFYGTDALKPGFSEWQFDWQAPANTLTSNIMFYAAGISANDDGTDKNDFTFTTKQCIKLNKSVKKVMQDNIPQLYFDAINKQVKINFVGNILSPLVVSIYNTSGQLLYNNQYTNIGFQAVDINLNSLSINGLFFVSVQNIENIIVQKFISSN
jgi:hypothetical protein